MKKAILSVLLAVAAVPLYSTQAETKQAETKKDKSGPAKSALKEAAKPVHRIVMVVKGTLAVSKDDKGNVSSATITGEDGAPCRLGSFSLSQNLNRLEGKQVITKGVMEDEKGIQVLRVMSTIKVVSEKKTGGNKK